MQCSFELSEYTANVDGVGTLRLLDAIRTCGLEKTVKFYQVGCGGSGGGDLLSWSTPGAARRELLAAAAVAL